MTSVAAEGEQRLGVLATGVLKKVFGLMGGVKVKFGDVRNLGSVSSPLCV